MKSFEWHRKLGHPSFKYMKQLKINCEGMNFSIKNCYKCASSKSTRSLHNTTREKHFQIFEVFHADLLDPCSISFNNKKYHLIIDDGYFGCLKINIMFNFGNPVCVLECKKAINNYFIYCCRNNCHFRKCRYTINNKDSF